MVISVLYSYTKRLSNISLQMHCPHACLVLSRVYEKYSLTLYHRVMSYKQVMSLY